MGEEARSLHHRDFMVHEEIHGKVSPFMLFTYGSLRVSGEGTVSVMFTPVPVSYDQVSVVS